MQPSQNNVMSDIEITLEFTPNPDTLKYATNRTLIPSGGVANFIKAEEALGASPLAEKLFQIPGVSAVMIGRTFVTLTVLDQDKLPELHPKILDLLHKFLESGESAVKVSLHEDAAPKKPLTEIEQKIVDILDRDIRPAVAMDGGDISFEKFEDGFVYLKMQGSCSGCPSSLMTLKMGVETRLRESIPEVQEVIPV